MSTLTVDNPYTGEIAFEVPLAGESEVREKFWRTAKKAARQIPFMEDVVAAYYCAMDKNTPLRAKGILVAALGYFVLVAAAQAQTPAAPSAG